MNIRKIRKTQTYLLVLTLLLVTLASGHVKGQERPIGISMTDLSPTGTLWIYTNALKQSSGWLIENANDENDPINLSVEHTHPLQAGSFDNNGYPLQVPFSTSGYEATDSKSLQASCLVLNNQPSPWFYPSGDYLLLFEGTGQVNVSGDVDGEFSAYTVAGEHVVPVNNPTSLGLVLTISASSASDPIRNVRLIFPDYVDHYQTEKFRQDVVDLVQPFHVLRYVKPSRTENNTIEEWADRTQLSQFSYYFDVENAILTGMPYEDIIEFSNLAQISPWISVPYRANDNYMQNLAQLINTHLDESLNLYLEYTNEAWNPSFPLTRAYMLEQGNAQNLATSTHPEVAEFEAIHRFYSKRMFEMFSIFEHNLDHTDRLIKVHGAQSDPFAADLVLEAYGLETVNPNDQRPDAIAPASYIGVYMFNDLADQGLNVCDHSAHDLLDTLRAKVGWEMAEMLTRYAEITEELGVDLFAYEGGQHVTEINFQAMEPCAQDLVDEMNKLPEIEDFICELFDTWYQTYDGELFMYFNLAEAPDAFGAFGVLESQWQSSSESQKWQGLENCVFEGVATSVAPNTTNDQIKIYPNPVKDQIQIRHTESIQSIAIYNLIGVAYLNIENVNLSYKALDIKELGPGQYFVKVVGESGAISTKKIIK